MALVNVSKKVRKAADKIGLVPGEEVLAGCTTNPSGTMKRMMAKELSGVVGAVLAGGSDGDDDVVGGLADRFQPGQNFVVLTDQRLLLIKVSTMTGKPKEILAEWSHNEVSSIVVEPGKLAMPFTVQFSDGSAVQVEGAKGSDPASVQEAYDSLG